MSVMNEQLRRLTRSADLPNATLQVLVLDGPGTVRRELSTISRIGLDSDAARQDMSESHGSGGDQREP
jgi:hypothetical protein